MNTLKLKCNKNGRPQGWRIGWKQVTPKGRHPMAGGRRYIAWSYKRTAPVMNRSLFNKYIEAIEERVRRIVYRPGRYVYARDESTGEEFPSLEALRAYRRIHNINLRGYGPAIHIHARKPILTAMNREYIKLIKVAYHPNEIVHFGTGNKIGVWRVKVLT